MARLFVIALLGLVGWAVARRWVSRLVSARDAPLVDEQLEQTRGMLVATGMLLVAIEPVVSIPARGVHEFVSSPLPHSGWTALAAFVVIVSLLHAYFPVRRELFGDRWPFRDYIGHIAITSLALLGPWVVVLSGPFLTHSAGPQDWLVGVVLALILWAWAVWLGPVTEWLLRARVYSGADADELGAIGPRAGLPTLRIVEAGPTTTLWANVIPLLTGPPPRVIASRPLLEHLGPEGRRGLIAREAARMAATPRRLLTAAMIPLTLGASLLGPLLADVAPELAPLHRALWVVGFAVCAIAVSVRVPARERRADRAAVELLGGDAAARAAVETMLRRIAMAARWASSSGSAGGVGSLEGRVAALGGVVDDAGSPDASGASLGVQIFRDATDPEAFVAIDDEGVQQLLGVPELPDPALAPSAIERMRERAHQTIRLSFEELSLLALAPWRGQFALMAIGAGGATIRVPLEPAEHERARDLVARAAGRVKGQVWNAAMGALGAATLLVGLSGFHLSFSPLVPGGPVLTLLVLSVVVLVSWRRPLVAAFGAMSVGLAAIALRETARAGVPGPVEALEVALIGLSGIIALGLAFRRRDPADGGLPPGGPWLAGALLLASSTPELVSILGAASEGRGLAALSAIARGSMGLMLPWVGAGVAWWVHPGALRRCLATIVLGAGLGVVVADTDDWLENVARDPLAAGSRLAVRTAPLPVPVAVLRLDGESWDLRLADAGRLIVFGMKPDGHHHHGDEQSLHTHRWEVQSVGGSDEPYVLEGAALAVGGGTAAVLLAVDGDRSMRLRRLDLADRGSIVWERAVEPDLPIGDVWVTLHDDAFAIVSSSEERRVVLAASIENPTAPFRRHEEPVVRGVWPQWGVPEQHVRVESTAAMRGPRMSLARILWIASPKADRRTIIWNEGGAARVLVRDSVTEPWCELPEAGGPMLCVAEGRERRWLWRHDLQRGLVPLGASGPLGWWIWTGARVASLHGDELVLVEPAAGTETRYPAGRESADGVRFAAMADRVALGRPRDGGIDLRLYELPLLGAADR